MPFGHLMLQLVLQPVCLVVLAIRGSPRAVIARLRSIYDTSAVGGHGAILSRRGAVSGGALTVSGPAPGDLSACVIRHRAVLEKLTVSLDADLVALDRCAIPSQSTDVTTKSRASTPHGAFATCARVGLTYIAHEVMQSLFAAGHEIAVACPLLRICSCLILVGSSLVGVGCGLLAVTSCLLGIRESLLSIGALLIVLQPAHGARLACTTLA